MAGPMTPENIVYLAEKGDTPESLLNLFPEEWRPYIQKSIKWPRNKELDEGTRINLNDAFENFMPGFRKLLKKQRDAEKTSGLPVHIAKPKEAIPSNCVGTALWLLGLIEKKRSVVPDEFLPDYMQSSYKLPNEFSIFGKKVVKIPNRDARVGDLVFWTLDEMSKIVHVAGFIGRDNMGSAYVAEQKSYGLNYGIAKIYYYDHRGNLDIEFWDEIAKGLGYSYFQSELLKNPCYTYRIVEE